MQGNFSVISQGDSTGALAHGPGRRFGLLFGILSVVALAWCLPAYAGASANGTVAGLTGYSGLPLINEGPATQRGITGTGVTVGVVDSGIDYTQPALAGHLVTGYDTITGRTTFGDYLGHGTEVTGVIVAQNNGSGMVGVAPGANVMGLRIAEDPVGYALAAAYGATPFNLPAAVQYGIDHGVRIFNLSVGNPNANALNPSFNRTTIAQQFGVSLNAYALAKSSGSVLVWASGNDYANQPSINSSIPYYFPEYLGYSLAVTSVDVNGQVPQYANYCGVAMSYCLAAPGGDFSQGLVTTQNGGGYIANQGTSFAAPHVTGALALAKELYPNATAPQLTSLVLKTASNTGTVNPYTGWGLLNVGNLVSTYDSSNGTPYANVMVGTTKDMESVGRTILNHGATSRSTSATGVRVSGTGGSSGLSGGDPTVRVWPEPAGANTGETTNRQSTAGDQTARPAAASTAAPAPTGVTNGPATGGVVVYGTPTDSGWSPENSTWTPSALWTEAILATGSTDSRTVGFERDTGGFVIGVDLYRDNGYYFGLGSGMTLSNTSSGGNGSDRGYHVFTYGGWSGQGLFVDATVSGSGFDQQFKRTRITGVTGTTGGTVLGNLGVAASSTDWAYGANAMVNAGLTRDFGSVTVEPYLLGGYSALTRSGFTESNADIFSLTVGSADTNVGQVGVGTRLKGAGITAGSFVLTPTGDVELAHYLGNLNGGSPFTLIGSSLQANSVKIGQEVARLGFSVQIQGIETQETNIVLGYGADLQDNYTGQHVQLSLHHRF